MSGEERAAAGNAGAERWTKERREEMERARTAVARSLERRLMGERTEQWAHMARAASALATTVLIAGGVADPWTIGSACTTMALCRLPKSSVSHSYRMT